MRRRFRILIVDDHTDVLRVLEAMLTAAGFEVVTAQDALSALRAAYQEHPDAILLDVMMPGMSGREVYDRIRQDPQTKDLKIAFLTVVKQSEISKDVDYTKIRISDFISKPFENDDLLNRVKKITD